MGSADSAVCCHSGAEQLHGLQGLAPPCMKENCSSDCIEESVNPLNITHCQAYCVTFAVRQFDQIM